jgi:hypothetical protein
MRSTVAFILALSSIAVSAGDVEKVSDGQIIYLAQAEQDAGSLAEPVAAEREALQRRMDALEKRPGGSIPCNQ